MISLSRFAPSSFLVASVIVEAISNKGTNDKLPATPVPIIAMSADAFSENVAECLDAGMNGHIAKPVDLKLVLSEIRKIKKN